MVPGPGCRACDRRGFFFRVSVGVALTLLGACGDKVPCDSDDSYCERADSIGECDPCWGCGAPQIVSISANCDEVGWWYDVYCVGLTGSAELYIRETNADDSWYEYGHAFPPTEPFSSAPDADTRVRDDAGGCWDDPYLDLGHVESPTDVVLSSTTLFDCTTERENTLTWSVVLYDTTGAEADCGSWGLDPTSFYEGNDFGACELL